MGKPRRAAVEELLGRHGDELPGGTGRCLSVNPSTTPPPLEIRHWGDGRRRRDPRAVVAGDGCGHRRRRRSAVVAARGSRRRWGGGRRRRQWRGRGGPRTTATLGAMALCSYSEMRKTNQSYEVYLLFPPRRRGNAPCTCIVKDLRYQSGGLCTRVKFI